MDMHEEELTARLEELEKRVTRLEAAPQPLIRWRTAASEGENAAPLPVAGSGFDAARIGQCILVVGGAYVLRALTELKVVPHGIGVALGFAYALFWIWRSTPIFAATGAVIAGALSWEAATRFHIIGAAGGGVLIAIAALALLWVATTRSTSLHAAIAAVMTIIASIGVAIGTADALPAVLTVAGIGVVISFNRQWDPYVTAGIAAANDSIAITLIALTVFERTPHDVRTVQATLIALVFAWLAAPLFARLRNLDENLRWPEIGQATIATIIGVGGAAALVSMRGGNVVLAAAASAVVALACYVVAFARTAKTAVGVTLTIAAAFAASVAMVTLLTGAVLAAFWSVAGLASAAAARRVMWPQLFVHAALWSVGGLVIGFNTTVGLVVAAALAAFALLLIPQREARYVRLTLLAVSATSALLIVMHFAPPASRSIVAFEWTALLALTIAALSLLSGRVIEASMLARILLIVAGVKVIIEDLRVGQATTLVASLALYGGAMLLFARRRHHTEA